jgi:hypothetical protein
MNETPHSSAVIASATQPSNRRRTQRVMIAMPVVIRVTNAKDAFYEEATETVVVNAHGCMVRLAVPLMRDQVVRIINPKSLEEQACRVVSVGQFADGKAEVGLEFSESSPRFWRIIFPPEDWNPAERKLPTPPK